MSIKKVTITIETENDAFADGAGVITDESARKELSRVLARLSMNFGHPGKPLAQKITDINGNTVGHVKIKE